MILSYVSQCEEFLGRAALDAARAHARAEFPKESCGFIRSRGPGQQNEYVACQNDHKSPLTHFLIDDARYDAALADASVVAVAHSHPYGPACPSQADMEQQIATDLPWVIITLNEDVIGQTVFWGGNLPVAPVISRPFIHGILDCYSLLRDTFRLGRDELALQGVHWPLAPVALPEVPRNWDWWKTEDDLYVTNLEPFGFRRITREEAQAGDIFLCSLGALDANPHRRINHAGVLLEYDQILHQLPHMISARSPAGRWARHADIWARYEGGK